MSIFTSNPSTTKELGFQAAWIEKNEEQTIYVIAIMSIAEDSGDSTLAE